MLEPKRQEDSMGCGVACVAFVLGKSYKSVKANLIKGRQKALKQGYLCKELVDALKRGGLMYTYSYLKRARKYKNSTIVFIKRSKRFPRGHYLVKTKQGWMDPWLNLDSDKDVKRSIAGFRKRLPGRASYALTPVESPNDKYRIRFVPHKVIGDHVACYNVRYKGKRIAPLAAKKLTIPLNEIWISTLYRQKKGIILFHELREIEYRYRGYSPKRAHALAKKDEKNYQK